MRTDADRTTHHAWAIARAAAVVVFVCASFTAAGALVLAVHTRLYPELDAIQSPGGIMFRLVLFGGVAAGSAAFLWKLRSGLSPVNAGTEKRGDAHLGDALDSRVRGNDGEDGVLEGQGKPRGVLLALVAVVGVAAVLLTFNLGAYPWAAPDEVHHLNVARNIAVHGSYASGHPDGGLLYFDSFDSVGPAVLGPIALAFKVFGVGLVPARAVIVLFFLGLCLVTYRFARAVFGPWAGVIAVGLLVGAYSSIYLGRTVYGEAPAYFFLLAGVLAWRRALGGTDRTDLTDLTDLTNGRFRVSSAGWGLFAGMLVALAILSKTIVVLVAFPFLGVWLYDRTTLRCIRWPHVVFPCLGGLIPLGGWAVFQHLHAPAGLADSGGALAIYQHYLLFGVSGFAEAFSNGVLAHPLAHVAWLGVVLLTVPVLFRERHDPAALVLFLYALFILYWWLFFTPGTLHRYLWNAYAILAIFAAPWVCRAAAEKTKRQGATPTRLAALAALAILTVPAFLWILHQSREIVTKREMAPEYALVEAVEALPAGARIATDIERLPGVLNFFGNRAVEMGTEPAPLLSRYDAVITRDSEALRAALPTACKVQPAGNFVLLFTAQPAE